MREIPTAGFSLKCEVCGKEVDLPFRCSFCDGNFCVEHRLPENHSCPQAPPRTPLGPWRPPRTPLEPKDLPSLPRRTRGEEALSCPKCASERVQTTAYRKNYIRYECLDCGFKWKQSRFVPQQSQKRKKRIPIKKIVALSIIVIIIGVVLWNAPTIISTVQSYYYQSFYRKVTVEEGPASAVTVQFGDTEYTFSYDQNRLVIYTPLVEAESHPAVEDATYRDFGIEINVSEVHPDYIVLLIKTTVQNYLSQSSFTKLTIAEGQYQTVNFEGNEYTFVYTYPLFKMTTPLLEKREFGANENMIYTALGLEIRVSKVEPDYIVLFIKPLY